MRVEQGHVLQQTLKHVVAEGTDPSLIPRNRENFVPLSAVFFRLPCHIVLEFLVEFTRDLNDSVLHFGLVCPIIIPLQVTLCRHWAACHQCHHTLGVRLVLVGPVGALQGARPLRYVCVECCCCCFECGVECYCVWRCCNLWRRPLVRPVHGGLLARGGRDILEELVPCLIIDKDFVSVIN